MTTGSPVVPNCRLLESDNHTALRYLLLLSPSHCLLRIPYLHLSGAAVPPRIPSMVFSHAVRQPLISADIVDTRSPSLSVSLAPNKSTNLANVKKIQEEPVFREPYKDPESEPPNPWLTESSPKRGRFVVVGGSSATKSSSSIECLTLEENWGKSASFSSKPMSKSCEEGSSKTIRGGGKQELATATSVFVVVVVRTVDVAFGSWYFREPIKFRNRQVGRFRRLRMGTEGISTARQRFWSSCSRYSVSIGSRSGREPNPSLSSSNVSSLS